MIIVWEWHTSQIIPSTLYYLSLSWRIWYDNFHCLLILVFIFFWQLLLWCHLIWGNLYCIEHTLYYFIIKARIPLKKLKHTTHLLRNIYLYLCKNRCSTIDPGLIVKKVQFCERSDCSVMTRYTIIICFMSSNWRQSASRPFNKRDSPCSWNALYLRN